MHKSKIFIFKGCKISVNSCLLFSDEWVPIKPSFVFCQVSQATRVRKKTLKSVEEKLQVKCVSGAQDTFFLTA